MAKAVKPAGKITDEHLTKGTAGAGVEYGFASNWSIKAEYLHIDLGSSTCVLANCATISVANVPFHAEIFRVGLNYRFGGFGPIAARY